MKEFKAIILGTDLNAYGVARSIHEAYGLSSICLGKKELRDTEASKICEVRIFENFDREDIFLKSLMEIKKEYKNLPLLLISCSDGYTSLITKNREVLKESFIFNYIDEKMQSSLENKKDFYKICENYGLDYPKTQIISYEEKDKYEIKMAYPLALKPNDSIEYVKIKFPNKKKAYKIHSEEEMRKTVKKIYDAGYTGELIVQDFIPGDTSAMFVLNAYVNTRGKVKFMSLGKCLLDEVLPLNIGNYNALLSMGDEKIYKNFEKFLEEISYRGYANFDLKYDYRDGSYKVFEINIRQGRSSYYMNAAGSNFIKPLVEDLILESDKDCYYEYKQGLWLYVDPFVLKKYVADEDRKKAEEALKKGFVFTTWYKKDRSIKRFLSYMRRRLSTIKYYPIYFGKN